MIRLVARRVIHGAFLLLLLSWLAFLMMALAPGDFLTDARVNPALSADTLARLNEQYGLHRPLAVRYTVWLRSVASGDFGLSLAYNLPVSVLLWPRVEYTLLLGTLALMSAWASGISLAIWSVMRGSRLRRVMGLGVATLASVPDLLVALLLLWAAVRLSVWQSESRLWLAVLALSAVSLPAVFRHAEAALREALAQPFVESAWAQGLSPSRVWLWFVLPAAANPLLTLLGLHISMLLSASLIVEVVFGWPGLGPLLVEAILARDTALVLGAVLLSAVLLLAGNLLADLLLLALDPRLRDGESQQPFGTERG